MALERGFEGRPSLIDIDTVSTCFQPDTSTVIDTIDIAMGGTAIV